MCAVEGVLGSWGGRQGGIENGCAVVGVGSKAGGGGDSATDFSALQCMMGKIKRKQIRVIIMM